MEYDYKCQECGLVFTVTQSLHQEHKAKHCGKDANRVWGPTPHTWTWREGFDVGLGKYFNTQRERDRYAAEKGWRPIKC